MGCDAHDIVVIYISTTISCCERRGRYATEQGHSLDLRVLLLSKLPARTESSDALALSSKVIARKHHQGCTRRLLVCLSEGGGVTNLIINYIHDDYDLILI